MATLTAKHHPTNRQTSQIYLSAIPNDKKRYPWGWYLSSTNIQSYYLKSKSSFIIRLNKEYKRLIDFMWSILWIQEWSLFMHRGLSCLRWSRIRISFKRLVIIKRIKRIFFSRVIIIRLGLSIIRMDLLCRWKCRIPSRN